MLIHVTDPDDERLADYTRLTDVALRSRSEPAKGLYIAESSTVIRRAVAAGHRPRSFLMAERWLGGLTDVLAAVGAVQDRGVPDADGPGGDGTSGDRPGGDVSARDVPEGAVADSDVPEGAVADGDVPVYVGEPDVLEAITGFHLHRGALAAMHRPVLEPVETVLARARDGAGARRVAVLEDIVDHTNVGAVFRSAAALGVDAVLVTPRCADPLYRRSVRVSMGTVFQVPWTRIDLWPGGVAGLRAAGFAVAALALADDAIALDELATTAPDRLALVLGTEGDGLSRGAVEAADQVVRIPMSGGVDSLNVAAASAVAFWATRA